MFWFIACLMSSPETTTCTTPVKTETEAECRQLEQAYKANAKSTYAGAFIRTRCEPIPAASLQTP